MVRQGDYNKKGNAEQTLNEAMEASVELNGETNSEDNAVGALAQHVNRTAEFDENVQE
ncbi:hypothetical protein ACFFK0_11350 [Paenibacillus chartarius]|uniref:DUF4025 domain-containing protein n=1 Tax=Paenibacillus chartarius TaxID=747481 RepID=A0ABV6DK56_9BACL